MFWIELKEFLKDSMKLIIVLIVIFFVLLYCFSITQVVGNSMNPNFENKDLLILNKFIYHFTEIKRGDIVSVSTEGTKYLIKRVIGLPGETIEIKDNKLYIDGEIYEEDYLYDDLEYDDFKLSDIDYDVIPDDMYFVLGDNREDSLDSRNMGLVKKKEVEGKIVFRFWPLKKIEFI